MAMPSDDMFNGPYDHFSYLLDNGPHLLYVVLKINGQPWVALIDTGASISLAHPRLSDAMQLFTAPSKTIKGVNGVTTLTHQTNLKIELESEVVFLTVYVMEGLLKNIIIGHDFLLRVRPLIYYRNQTIVMGEHMDITLPFFLQEDEAKSSIELPHVFHIEDFPSHSDGFPVRVRRAILISPRSYADVEVDFEDSLKDDANPMVFHASERFMDQHSVVMPDYYVPVSEFRTVRVLSLLTNVRINEGTVIGYLDYIWSACVADPLPVPPFLKKRAAHMTDAEIKQLDINPTLNKAQRTALEILLRRYGDVFCWDPMQMGYYSGDYPDGLDGLRCIYTGDTKPIYQRPYKMNFADREYMRGEVKRMTDRGLIVPAATSWTSPAVLVSKPNGSKRLTIDLRRLNTAIKTVVAMITLYYHKSKTYLRYLENPNGFQVLI